MNETILCLDLGTNCGWAVRGRNGVVASGVQSLKPGRYDGGGMRFVRFQRFLEEIYSGVEVQLVYYEEVRRHVSTDSAHVYGGLMGTLTAWCETKKIPYEGVPVGTIKKSATGKGNSDKAAMIEAAKRLYPDQFVPDDNVADALCILNFACSL